MFAGILAVASCQHDVVYKADYNITLDKDNTYYAGDPVKFNITGEVDNLVFYSGENGSQYIYKDRYFIEPSEVKNAVMNLDVKGRYGSDFGSLEIWVSGSFEGLSGKDGAADKAKIAALVDAGMPSWTKLDYVDDKANDNNYVRLEVPLNDYLDNMSMAFHWCPPTNTRVQRTYHIKGTLEVEVEGMDPLSQRLRELGLVHVMMNDELDPYHNSENNAMNGSLYFPQVVSGKPDPEQDIFMQGENPNVLSYALDGWAFTTPQPLSKVANDKGTVIKNLQNYLHTYEYTWTKPGTYKVTFVGRNENYAASSEEIIEYTIIILEKPE